VIFSFFGAGAAEPSSEDDGSPAAQADAIPARPRAPAAVKNLRFVAI